VTESDNPFPEPVVLELGDTLDLHHFSPKEVADLLDDWLDDCLRAGLREVRVIHGRGKGVLRERVQTLLARHPLVEDFRTEPGNPGATLARIFHEGRQKE
jgi:DNA-nicking Smr family endonuclease